MEMAWGLLLVVVVVVEEEGVGWVRIFSSSHALMVDDETPGSSVPTAIRYCLTCRGIKVSFSVAVCVTQIKV